MEPQISGHLVSFRETPGLGGEAAARRLNEVVNMWVRDDSDVEFATVRMSRLGLEPGTTA